MQVPPGRSEHDPTWQVGKGGRGNVSVGAAELECASENVGGAKGGCEQVSTGSKEGGGGEQRTNFARAVAIQPSFLEADGWASDLCRTDDG